MFRNTFTFKRLFDFGGRATRREYFLVLGAVFVSWTLLISLHAAMFGAPGPEGAAPTTSESILFAIYGLLGIATFVILLAALVRRVHDHDKPGIVILLNVIPMIGWIFWLIQVLSPGNRYENSY